MTEEEFFRFIKRMEREVYGDEKEEKDDEQKII
jgi:hypothetical protein